MCVTLAEYCSQVWQWGMGMRWFLFDFDCATGKRDSCSGWDGRESCHDGGAAETVERLVWKSSQSSSGWILLVEQLSGGRKWPDGPSDQTCRDRFEYYPRRNLDTSCNVDLDRNDGWWVNGSYPVFPASPASRSSHKVRASTCALRTAIWHDEPDTASCRELQSLAAHQHCNTCQMEREIQSHLWDWQFISFSRLTNGAARFDPFWSDRYN